MEHNRGLYTDLLKRSQTINQTAVQCLPFEEIERDLHRWEGLVGRASGMGGACGVMDKRPLGGRG